MDWETNRNTIATLWPAANFSDAEAALYRQELAKLDQDLLGMAIVDVKKKYYAEQPHLKWLLDEYSARREANRQEAKWKSPQPWEVNRGDTFKCPTCQDTGMARVYARKSVDQIKKGKTLRRAIDLKAYRPIVFKDRDSFPERGEDRRVHVAEDTQRAYWFAMPRDASGALVGFPGVYKEMGGSCAQVAFVCCTCQTAEERYGRWEPSPPRYNPDTHCLIPSPPYTPSSQTIDEDEERIMAWLDETGTARCGHFSADQWAAAQ